MTQKWLLHFCSDRILRIIDELTISVGELEVFGGEKDKIAKETISQQDQEQVILSYFNICNNNNIIQ